MGNGQSTSIWTDQWLAGSPTRQPLGTLIESNAVLVADLIDVNSCDWKEELIRETFFPADADAILSIKLPRSGGDDIWSWAEERTGLYSVRSAYRMLIQDRVDWWRILKDIMPCFATLTS